MNWETRHAQSFGDGGDPEAGEKDAWLDDEES
jgi:hypothetical protein